MPVPLRELPVQYQQYGVPIVRFSGRCGSGKDALARRLLCQHTSSATAHRIALCSQRENHKLFVVSP